jgi:cysteamine dioxygenase
MASSEAAPLVRQIKAKAFEIFSSSRSLTWSDASSLAAMVDQVTLADVGLSPPTDRAPPYDGKIKFMTLASCRDFEIVVIILPAKTRIPLHDHPGMLVLSRLLCGDMRVRAFDVDMDMDQPSAKSHPDEPIRGYGVGALRGRGHTEGTVLQAKLVHDEVFSGPATLSLLPEEGGNIHAFEAVTPCAIFDVLAPPYDWSAQRGCQYFTEVKTGLHQLMPCEPPDDFETSRWDYTGPALD